MSKIKFDKKDFEGASAFWGLVFKWSEAVGEEKSEQAVKLDKAVQRLIKKYVKRERKRLARVMQPTTITREELIELLKQERTKPMNWPADFPGKH